MARSVMLTAAMMELGRASSIKASMDERNAASETHVAVCGSSRTTPHSRWIWYSEACDMSSVTVKYGIM
jgi:hypothetical protein